MMELLLVTGAGGFIGHHLVKHLVAEGHRVRGVDLKHPEFEASPAHEFEIADLRRPEACLAVTRDVRQVYHLASDTGDGYFTIDHAKVMRNNTVMNLHLLDAARVNRVNRFLFSSSFDQLVSLVAEVAGKSVRIRHHRWMPEDPRGCSSENALLRHVLGWEPQTSMAEGLARTYAWIAQRVARSCPDVGATVVRASAAGPLREHMITASG